MVWDIMRTWFCRPHRQEAVKVLSTLVFLGTTHSQPLQLIL